MSTIALSSERISKKRIVLIGLIALTFTAGLIFLGSWQIQRMLWKHDLMERVEQNIHAAPINAPDKAHWLNLDPKTLEYRAVKLHGHYLNDKETQVAALTELGSGFWIVTPFQRDDGEITFVNRGFVPVKSRDPQMRSKEPTDEDITITGLLRLTEPKGFFLRQNNPAENIWHSRDVAALAQFHHLQNVSGYFVDADGKRNVPTDPAQPIGGLTVVKFADNHLVYALTWFSLALMMLFMAGFLIRYELKRNKAE